MASFRGVDRRFDFKIKNDRIVFLSDYAHHPSEIKQSVLSMRELYKDKKITAIFQPHLYTRTRDFYQDFADSLSLLDEVILVDIYPAREAPIPGITSRLIYDNLRPGIEKSMCKKEDILNILKDKNIEVLITLGACLLYTSRDHLDYHKTVENYLKAKKKFFDDLPKNAFSLTNLDDKNGLVMTQNTRSKVYTYSLRSLSDFKGRVLESHFEGMLLDFNNHELAVQFIGKFNASNLLAVFGAAVLLGKKEEDVLVALSTLHPVAGRFDAVRCV